MPSLGAIIPRRFVHARHGAHVAVPTALLEAARTDIPAALAAQGSRAGGLTSGEAAERLARDGPNTLTAERGGGRWPILGKALLNPLVVLLAVLAAISFATGDAPAGAVMVVMVALGVAVRAVQESRADAAARSLRAMITVTATALRDRAPREVPLAELVPGDVVTLAAGDMVPADVRLLASRDLFVVQASLTGEALPVEKHDAPEPPDGSAALELRNVCFLGTSVESGTATALVVATGERTYLGGIAAAVGSEPPPTAFDRGIARFTALMLRFMAVMVPVVLVVNGVGKGDWKEAFFFALAVAVGLTPEMLPMIVTVCLSKGALVLSRKQVIVKRLPAIQNLGAMDVLCTDKTGTLTADRVVLERHCDVTLEEDEEVLALAILSAHFQTGLRNVLDRAILAHRELHEQVLLRGHEKIDELPFDFARRLMSVVVTRPEGGHRLVCKGAPEEVFRRCVAFDCGGERLPMDHVLIDDLRTEEERLSAEGFRVLAIAYRDFAGKPAYGKEDEAGLVLRGYVAFFDPPKDSAAPALEALRGHGIAVKVLTGDGEAVSRKVCRDVGLPVPSVLDGARLEAMTDAELEAAVEEASLFARLAPFDKQRVVAALQRRGHVVGFLGDGINDGPALRTADVGISVDSAADVARESADLILLEKSLLVLDEGVLEGRKVFANILKYLRMGASSSFGNVLSVVGASLFLPFVPMTPIQILTTNLLYDFSQIPIPTDDVDSEQIARPQPWSMERVRRFISFMGPCSSIFDYTTFLALWFVLGANTPAGAALFQTGWFVESLLTQTLVIHVIRTNRLPFVQSRASPALTAATLGVAALGVWLPFSPLARPLGLVTLPPTYWPLLAATLLGYVLLAQGAKWWLLRGGAQGGRRPHGGPAERVGLPPLGAGRRARARRR
jgi:Mg2+-importing ATPase